MIFLLHNPKNKQNAEFITSLSFKEIIYRPKGQSQGRSFVVCIRVSHPGIHQGAKEREYESLFVLDQEHGRCKDFSSHKA